MQGSGGGRGRRPPAAGRKCPAGPPPLPGLSAGPLPRIQVAPRSLLRPEPFGSGRFFPRRIKRKGAYGYEEHRKDHGSDRGTVQGPGLRLPRQRDLRRPGQLLGLRPPGRGAEKQRQAGLVEEVCPGKPLQRGPGRRHPHEPRGVGGLRPCVHLQRSPHRLQGLQDAPPGRQAHRGLVRREWPRRRECGGHDQRGAGALHPGQRRDLPRLRQGGLHRHPQVQPHVQDPPGRHRGQQHRGLPAPRDRPGHLRQLPRHPAHHPQEAAFRSVPGGQVLPQRDHPRQLHLPHPGV